MWKLVCGSKLLLLLQLELIVATSMPLLAGQEFRRRRLKALPRHSNFSRLGWQTGLDKPKINVEFSWHIWCTEGSGWFVKVKFGKVGLLMRQAWVLPRMLWQRLDFCVYRHCTSSCQAILVGLPQMGQWSERETSRVEKGCMVELVEMQGSLEWL